MKPLELKIKGINSFRAEQTIDFRFLGEYSLFGIFGPTGSGKSSILDAIILALYGVVPRAGNGAAGIINQMEDAAEVAFRFELTGAEGRQEYLIQRRYRRDKNNPDSAHFVSGRLIRVIEPDGEVLASKDSELKSSIVELLGLSAQDFTRAVVLPQGRFAEFLALKGRERTDMLERIFALEQFGEKLNQSLKTRLAAAASALQMLQSEMNGMGDASNRALELARQTMEQARQEASASESEEDAARMAYDEQRKVWELQQSLGQVQGALEQLQARSNEIEGLRERAIRARQAEEVRPLLEAFEFLEKEVQTAGIELESAAAGEQKERQDAERYRRELSQAEQQWQEEAPLINARLEKLREVMDLERESAEGHRQLSCLQTAVQSDETALGRLLNQLMELEDRKKTGEAEQERLAGERDNLRVEPDTRERVSAALNHLLLLEKAQKSRMAVEQSLRDKANELLEHEKTLAGANQAFEEVQSQIDQAEQTLERLGSELVQCMGPEEYARHQNTLEYLETARNSWRQGSGKVAELQTGWDSKLEEYQQLLSEMGGLESQRAAELESISDLTECYRRETDRNQAAQLAGLLQPGEPCPVCGSLDHPRPARYEQDHRAEIDDTIARLQAKLSGIEEALSRLNTKLGAVQAAIEMQEGLCQEAQRQREEDRVSVDAWLEKLPEVVRDLTVMDARQWLEQKRVEYERKSAELRNLEQGLMGLERERGLALAEKEKMTGILTHSRRRLAEISSSLETELHEENELAQLFTVKAQGLDAGALREQTRLIQEKDQLALKIEKSWQSLVNELQKTNQDLDQLRLDVGRAEQELALQKAEAAATAQNLARLDAQILDATSGKPVRNLLTELESSLQEMEKRLTNSRQQAEQSDRQVEAAVKRLSAAQTRAYDVSEHHTESKTNLKGVLTRCNFASAGEARAALAGQEELLAWEESIRQFEDEGRQLNQQKLALEEARQGLTVSEEQWEASRQRLQQAAQTTRDALERKAVTHNQWQVLAEKNERWRAIEEEQISWQEQNGRLLLLQSLLRGKDFVKFIAGEQLRYICQSASLRLQQLSRARYGLELDSDNNFVIRDDHNGGLRRAVSTLSGGETFLASLALALALSAQIQLRGQYPLEFFFLDEGFGTLDPELLETVMNSLESLRHERFMIGVISHVPELKNRLPRQVQVLPAEPGGAGTLLKLI